MSPLCRLNSARRLRGFGRGLEHTLRNPNGLASSRRREAVIFLTTKREAPRCSSLQHAETFNGLRNS